MSVEDRLERLERRIAVLETVVRGLAGQGTATPAPRPVATDLPGSVPVAAPAPASPEADSPPPPPSESRAPAPPPAPPPPPPPRPRSDSFRSPINEQWIGQRGLLAVGVLALLMATGYLLKL
jgi:uncharacterized membrane protein